MKNVSIKRFIFLTTLLLSLVSVLAKAQEKDISIMDNLIGGTWQAKSSWNDGTPFKLKIEWQQGLTGQILKSKTYGFTDKNYMEFGLRNEGIVAFDQASGKLKFWEFDVFGGITEGQIRNTGKNIYYSYKYETSSGTMELTDGWEYVTQNQYDYIIGQFDWDSAVWNNKFLVTTMNRKSE